LRTVKRQFFAIHSKEILAKEFAQRRKQVSKPPDDRIIAAHGIFGLQPINHKNNQCGQRNKTQREHKQHHKNLNSSGGEIHQKHLGSFGNGPKTQPASQRSHWQGESVEVPITIRKQFPRIGFKPVASETLILQNALFAPNVSRLGCILDEF
jgi:hypothetical protein